MSPIAQKLSDAGNAQDLAVGKPRDLLPQLEGVIIVDIDGDQQPVLGQRKVLGDKFQASSIARSLK